MTNLKGVDYNNGHFPVTQRHVDAHFGFSMALRPPNGREAAEAIAGAYRKVFDQINRLEAKTA